MNPTYLIVNADDFGYFDSVSRGIIDAARLGTVTATGILANGLNLERQTEKLSALPELDIGVHLNLTSGRPCSAKMRAQLNSRDGLFPGKFAIVNAVLRRSIEISTIESEWRAQIERCLSLGLQIRFLNSHEHLHMLPILYNVAGELAREFNILHVRHTTAEWRGCFSLGGAARNIILAVLGLLNRGKRVAAVSMLGLSVSGDVNLNYLKKRLATLTEGGIYELMCHPGMIDQQEMIDPRLKAYHDWDSERIVLCSDEFRQLLDQHNIRLIGYRDLIINDNGLGIDESRSQK